MIHLILLNIILAIFLAIASAAVNKKWREQVAAMILILIVIAVGIALATANGSVVNMNYCAGYLCNS